MAIYSFKSSKGEYWIREKDGFITNISFGPLISPGEGDEVCETALMHIAEYQIRAYFAGILKVFSLPINPAGTDFQIKIWSLLCRIPYGTTATYGQIAAKAGNPHAARAVGSACHCNPIPIIIPCHRVVGCTGKLTGYAGGIELKQKLLELEQNTIFDQTQ